MTTTNQENTMSESEARPTIDCTCGADEFSGWAQHLRPCPLRPTGATR